MEMNDKSLERVAGGANETAVVVGGWYHKDDESVVIYPGGSSAPIYTAYHCIKILNDEQGTFEVYTQIQKADRDQLSYIKTAQYPLSGFYRISDPKVL